MTPEMLDAAIARADEVIDVPWTFKEVDDDAGKWVVTKLGTDPK